MQVVFHHMITGDSFLFSLLLLSPKKSDICNIEGSSTDFVLINVREIEYMAHALSVFP